MVGFLLITEIDQSIFVLSEHKEKAISRQRSMGQSVTYKFALLKALLLTTDCTVAMTPKGLLSVARL